MKSLKIEQFSCNLSIQEPKPASSHFLQVVQMTFIIVFRKPTKCHVLCRHRFVPALFAMRERLRPLRDNGGLLARRLLELIREE